MLTEAFGCDRCQQIFVVDEKKQVIEQLSTNYPYKRAWRWTGSRWNAASYGLGETGLSALFTIVILLVIFVFYLALRPLAGLSMIWTTLPVFLVVISLLALMFWLANRY
jgi:Cu/Ag efflux pump CusA